MFLPIIDHLFTFDKWYITVKSPGLPGDELPVIHFRNPILKKDIGPFRFNTVLNLVTLDLETGILHLYGKEQKFQTKITVQPLG